MQAATGGAFGVSPILDSFRSVQLMYPRHRQVARARRVFKHLFASLRTYHREL